MKKHKIIYISLALFSLMLGACSTSKLNKEPEIKTIPNSYGQGNNYGDTTQPLVAWKTYFDDPNLVALIDTALQQNLELKKVWQEIEISKNEVRARKGEYLPFLGIGAGAATEKPGEFTRFGALEKQLEVKPGEAFPEPLKDFNWGLHATWEIDIWKKLRNAKKSAALRYLASIEGKHFLSTQLVAEIAESYYELLALDNMLAMVEMNIEIQANALKVVRQQKESAKVTQLAVNRFEAQLLNTQNLPYQIRQRMVETENHLNKLCGRYPQAIVRRSDHFLDLGNDSLSAGVPAQLLQNRPDIKQAERQLAASRLDVKVARAHFYPSLGISAGMGYQAFKPGYLVQPESMIYNLAGDVLAPLINRNAIKAAYNTAKAKQLQALYSYQQSLIDAYVDVLNQQNKVKNFEQSYQTKRKQVDILMQSVQIANNLFLSARADYAEVLFTQREALESKMELIDIKMQQMQAKVNLYRSLGGGWR